MRFERSFLISIINITMHRAIAPSWARSGQIRVATFAPHVAALARVFVIVGVVGGSHALLLEAATSATRPVARRSALDGSGTSTGGAVLRLVLGNPGATYSVG
jgi:hypothetical protein